MSLYFIGTILNLASLYMIAGIGCLICLKGGAINLGGEGQIYLGGFITAIMLSSDWCKSMPAPIALLITFIMAMTVSGCLSIFSGFLSYKKHADFLFTSFIISAAIIPLIDGLIAGPFRSSTGNLLATPFIEQKFRMKVLMPPSTMNFSFIFAILLCLNYAYTFKCTSNGRKLAIFGISSKFASYAGYNKQSLIYTTAFGTGALHGLCGAIAVVGTYYTCHSGFYASMGWNAFTAALLAGGNPIMLIPSSIFLAGIINTSETVAMYHNFGFDMSGMIQAFFLFGIACFRRRENDI